MVTTISFTIRDSDADRATMRLNVPSTLTLAEVTAWAQTVAGQIDACTEGVIEQIVASVAIALPSGIKTTTTNSDVEHGARFSFQTANGFTTSFRIPAFVRTKFVGKEVLQADTDVAALLSSIITGTPEGGAVDARGEDITGVVAAVESFRA